MHILRILSLSPFKIEFFSNVKNKYFNSEITKKNFFIVEKEKKKEDFKIFKQEKEKITLMKDSCCVKKNSRLFGLVISFNCMHTHTHTQKLFNYFLSFLL